jgi:hypothetical protein
MNIKGSVGRLHWSGPATADLIFPILPIPGGELYVIHFH